MPALLTALVLLLSTLLSHSYHQKVSNIRLYIQKLGCAPEVTNPDPGGVTFVNPAFCGVNHGPRKEKKRAEVSNARKPLREREWVSRDGYSNMADSDLFTSSVTEIDKTLLKIITYNVLGPLHGESSKHDYATEAITRWSRRRDRLIEEIVDLEADILCLQEVSQKALKETFIPRLLGSGLECTGFAPSKRGNGQTGKYAHKYVGCAIFTRSAKLELLESKRVHLRDWAPVAECQSTTLREEMQSHWNCMAMGLFRVRSQQPRSHSQSPEEGGATIMVGNAHLFWNPARADVKVLQAAACTHALAKFMEETTTAAGVVNADGGLLSPKLVLCGDFNTPPTLAQQFDPQALYDEYEDIYGDNEHTATAADADDGSEFVGVSGALTGPFQYLSGGRIDSDHPHHPDNWSTRLPGDKGLPNPRLGPLLNPFPGMMHPLIDIAAFRPHQPLFTTRTDDFSGWIDHVWCSQGVEVTAVMVPAVRAGDLEASLKSRAFAPIPDKDHPSDHLPLGVMVRL
jgi:mRNA deadenylase 3'-5' endonuclease subunit Ccr4